METQHRIRHELRRRLAVFPRGLLLLALLVGSVGVSSDGPRRYLLSQYPHRQRQQSGHPRCSLEDAGQGTVQRQCRRYDRPPGGRCRHLRRPVADRVSYRATALQQFTITWTFDTDYAVGQFATGDFWVVGSGQDRGIDPPSVVDSTGRVTNGSMLNPSVGCALPQGYDSAMPAITYDAKNNVAWGVSAEGLLDSSRRRLPCCPASACRPPAAIPQLARDRRAHGTGQRRRRRAASGPPYCGPLGRSSSTSRHWTTPCCRSSAPVAGTPAWPTWKAQFAAPWIEHAGGWTATALRPELNMPNYGRGHSQLRGPGGALAAHEFHRIRRRKSSASRSCSTGSTSMPSRPTAATAIGWARGDRAAAASGRSSWPVCCSMTTP